MKTTANPMEPHPCPIGIASVRPNFSRKKKMDRTRKLGKLIPESLKTVISYWKSYGESKFHEPEISQKSGKSKIMKFKTTWKLSKVTGKIMELLSSASQSYRKNRENLIVYESLSNEEPTLAPIPPAPKPAEPPRQGRSRGRGVLMYTKESLRESPRERSVSRIRWVRRLAEQQEDN
ncbi:hypothetical protein DAPPUDRAFT_249745 [Daphnia pulex]|uniref:Uncharacterized protein n=1 Tax=Daphnia pulex TaxID=6669 RepID=E9GX85_DAPPU|nr:hypothetical protein DAPPUDRAFT_249745 [Daphnia pulex]|eukprot:EFX75826.1 hypothetical protein DAPPUDRAFT_249745 [Daphnia pulex]